MNAVPSLTVVASSRMTLLIPLAEFVAARGSASNVSKGALSAEILSEIEDVADPSMSMKSDERWARFLGLSNILMSIFECLLIEGGLLGDQMFWRS